MRTLVLTATVSAAALTAALVPRMADAAVVYTQLATPLNSGFNSGGGCCDGTGIWFDPLSGYAETRGYLFPDPLYEDGKFFLFSDASSGEPEAQVYTEGYFSRGNGVIYASASNLNPARFDVGQVIGPSTGYQNPGAGYPDLGPDFGNWAPGRGFLGLTLRDPNGSSSSDVFYGYADITVNADYSITLNAFAFEDVEGQTITTSFNAPVPEPSSALLWAAGLLGLAGLRRRR